MSRHTAPEELLLDYAAGALAAGPALAVALHVALDPAARRAVERLGALGGALMEGEGDTPFDEDLLKSTLARLDGVSVEPRPQPYVPRPGFDSMTSSPATSVTRSRILVRPRPQFPLSDSR